MSVESPLPLVAVLFATDDYKQTRITRTVMLYYIIIDTCAS